GLARPAGCPRNGDRRPPRRPLRRQRRGHHCCRRLGRDRHGAAPGAPPPLRRTGAPGAALHPVRPPAAGLAGLPDLTEPEAARAGRPRRPAVDVPQVPSGLVLHPGGGLVRVALVPEPPPRDGGELVGPVVPVAGVGPVVVARFAPPQGGPLGGGGTAARIWG